MSCTKTANAQSTNYILPPATTSTLGGVIIGSGLSINSSGLLSTTSSGGLQQLNTVLYLKGDSTLASVRIWLANTDGTNQRKVPTSLTASQLIVPGYGERLSPDGKTVFFTVLENQTYNLYSCGTDGSNLKKIIDNITTLEGVY